MDYNKSKYTTMPENSYFDRRMANGDELSDIFDHVNKYGHPFSDKGCPILVQVGKLYNYVLNNFILFDSWFVIANEFGSAKWSYAYRRLNEKGIREGGYFLDEMDPILPVKNFWIFGLMMLNMKKK